MHLKSNLLKIFSAFIIAWYSMHNSCKKGLLDPGTKLIIYIYICMYVYLVVIYFYLTRLYIRRWQAPFVSTNLKNRPVEIQYLWKLIHIMGSFIYLFVLLLLLLFAVQLVGHDIKWIVRKLLLNSQVKKSFNNIHCINLPFLVPDV